MYRKWRPKTFDEIYGQEHISVVLKNQCSSGKTSHGYLFCGSRGTGKTTSARVLAAAINCLDINEGNPCRKCENCILIESGMATDINEIDAASNNSVDDIRSLREEVVYSPAALKKRVYIIDEVHMLSASAFNALLKTLEEPPEDVIFILATTELNKIPPTILSRCQRFEFRRIEQAVLKERIEFIANEEGINLTTEAADLIAKLADGGMRDALNMLESSASIGDGIITLTDVQDKLGVAGADTALKLIEAASNSDINFCLSILSQLHSSAKDLSSFLNEIIRIVRDLLVFSRSNNKNIISSFLTDDEFLRLKALSNEITTNELLYYAKVLEDTFYRFSRYSSNKLFELEMAAIKLCDPSLDSDLEALAARIAKLEVNRDVATRNFDEKIVPNDVERISDIKEPEQKKETIDVPWEVVDDEISFEDDDLDKKTELEEVIEDVVEEKIEVKEDKKGSIKKFLDSLKKEQQLHSLLSRGKVSLDGKKIVITTEAFSGQILKQKTSFVKLESALEKCFGDGYSIHFKIIEESEQDQKSLLVDIKIF